MFLSNYFQPSAPFAMQRLYTTGLSLLLFSSLLHSAGDSGTVGLQFGSNLNPGAGQLSRFTSTDGDGFSAANVGYIAAGYFTDETNLSANVGAFRAGTLDLDTFLSDFTVLSDSDFSGTLSGNDGFLQINNGTYLDDGSGFIETKTPYILTLEGISQWDDRSSASGIGLYGDTNLGTYDAVDVTNPTQVFDLQSFTFNSDEQPENIFLGTKTYGIDASEIVSGWTANHFHTQAIGAAVPEPSTYALMLGAASFGFVYYRRKVVSKKSKKN